MQGQRFWALVSFCFCGMAFSPAIFSQVQFSEGRIIAPATDAPTDVFAADLAGDGDCDILSASSGDQKIAWYPNDGAGNFIWQEEITTVAGAAQSVYAADLDGDGDPDVFALLWAEDEIVWYANNGGGNFGEPHVVTNPFQNPDAVYCADLDNDGDQDIITLSSKIGNSGMMITVTLLPNYPNPFNPTTTIRYGLPEASQVQLTVYDLRGEKVAMLIAGQQSAGWHSMQWNGRDDFRQQVSTGVYFYRLVAGEFVKMRKMVFMK